MNLRALGYPTVHMQQTHLVRWCKALGSHGLRCLCIELVVDLLVFRPCWSLVTYTCTYTALEQNNSIDKGTPFHVSSSSPCRGLLHFSPALQNSVGVDFVHVVFTGLWCVLAVLVHRDVYLFRWGEFTMFHPTNLTFLLLFIEVPRPQQRNELRIEALWPQMDPQTRQGLLQNSKKKCWLLAGSTSSML